MNDHLLPPRVPTHADDGTPYACAWESASQCWEEEPARRPSMDQVHHTLVTRSTVSIAPPSTPVYQSQVTPSGPLVRNSVTLQTASNTTIRNVLKVFRPRRQVIMLDGHTNWTQYVSFSPDSRTLASASDDRTIRFWDVALGQQLGRPLRGHTKSSTAPSFHRMGRLSFPDQAMRLYVCGT